VPFASLTTTNCSNCGYRSRLIVSQSKSTVSLTNESLPRVSFAGSSAAVALKAIAGDDYVDPLYPSFLLLLTIAWIESVSKSPRRNGRKVRKPGRSDSKKCSLLHGRKLQILLPSTSLSLLYQCPRNLPQLHQLMPDGSRLTLTWRKLTSHENSLLVPHGVFVLWSSLFHTSLISENRTYDSSLDADKSLSHTRFSLTDLIPSSFHVRLRIFLSIPQKTPSPEEKETSASIYH
jgi:hypothetical protein